MKILVGVDDSPHSKAALEWIRTMTWPKDTRVMVASVVRPIVGAYVEAYVPAADDLAETTRVLEQFHEETAAGAGRSLRAAGFPTEAKVLHGDPRNALVDLARTEHADLLVVGSHGRTGMTKLVMGSVASHVVTHAPCSVVVVKLPQERRIP